MFKSSSEQLQIRKKRKANKPPAAERLSPVEQLYDHEHLEEPREMPLSQACTPQGNNNNNNCCKNGSNVDSKQNIYCTSKRRAVAAGAGRPTEAKRKPSSESLSQSRLNALAKAASGNHGGSNSSRLQFSYLLGESLARCGRLQEAFDIYAIIAHDDLDGYIPLDRLNTLATCLISYLKQQHQPQHAELQTQGCLAQVSKIPWESNVKATFAKRPASVRRNILNHAAETAAAAVLLEADSEALNGRVARKDFGDLTAVDVDRDCSVDPLLCPVCQDILRCPVTMNCGHTFCRQCCEAITMCNLCKVKLPRCYLDDDSVGERNLRDNHLVLNPSTNSASPLPPAPPATRDVHNNNSRSEHTTASAPSTDAMATATTAASSSGNLSLGAAKERITRFMPDVLVRRLVEKWWGADLQAKKINETAASYMHLNLLDDALKFCNASLEKCPMNFKSLLLRAEVLRKLLHFQSSLADIDSALKSHSISAKAYYQRSLTLAELGRLDEALHDRCLAICLDRSTNLTISELFQHDLAKLLQKWLAQMPKHSLPFNQHEFPTSSPYRVLSEHRMRRRQINFEMEHLGALHEEGDACEVNGYGALIAAEEVEQAFGDMDHFISPKTVLYASIATDYELMLQRPSYRKHCRRKWIRQETELMPSELLYEGRCSDLFRSVLSRSLQELQRLTKLQSSEKAQQRKLISVNANLVDVSDFDCVLCCRTFWKPVVTPCGHTYCWVCLDRCMDYTSSCPLCMSPLVEPLSANGPPPGSASPVPFVLAQRPVTKFLEAAMKRFIPDTYARRFRQEMDLEPSVPVFICTTAFPHVACPLFVYEPRYRLMVRRAVESGQKQFGIVQPHSGKSRYFDVGTILDIRDCVLLGDGCSILSTVGHKRFKILARSEKDGYETAKVEYIYDESITDEQVGSVSAMHGAVLHKAGEWIDSLSKELKQEIVQSFGEMPLLEDNWQRMADGPAWAWWIIALLPLSQQLKVDILTTTSLEKRLRAIEKTLDYMLGSFRRSAQHSCSVVVQQHQQCDSDIAPDCQTEEFCLAATAALAPSSETPADSSEPHTQLLL